LQHQTNTLQPTETGNVTTTVTFGPGINEVKTCRVSAAKPTVETNAQRPSWHAIASARSTLPLPIPEAPHVAPGYFRNVRKSFVCSYR